MRAALANASVQKEQADEDLTTLALCERVATLPGTQHGVFMPSGSRAEARAAATILRGTTQRMAP